MIAISDPATIEVAFGLIEGCGVGGQITLPT